MREMRILRKTAGLALDKARKLGPESLIALIGERRLSGRGGPRIATALKWKALRDSPGEGKYIICNANEGEPGSFKDRFILENNLETMLEGLLIAAYATGATRCFFYINADYQHASLAIGQRVARFSHAHPDLPKIEVVHGAGAYICGEQSAILQSIMGLRGNPLERSDPRYSTLWGNPAMVQNVETLTCAAQAIAFDDWDQSLRLFSLSGNVALPGVYEFPIGTELGVLIDAAKPAKKLKAFALGSFGGVFTIDRGMRLTDDVLGSHHGAFALIFVDVSRSVLDVAYSLAKFYAYESCGKCTPCREGNMRALLLVRKVRDGKASQADLDMLKEIATHINETSLCGLGQNAGNHILTSMENFKDEWKARGQR